LYGAVFAIAVHQIFFHNRFAGQLNGELHRRMGWGRGFASIVSGRR
jgi:hypothetical protein